MLLLLLLLSPQHADPVPVQVRELQHHHLLVCVLLVPEVINNRRSHVFLHIHADQLIISRSPVPLVLRVVQVGVRTSVQTAVVQNSFVPVDPAWPHITVGYVYTLEYKIHIHKPALCWVGYIYTL